MAKTTSFREVSRRAVQAEITAAALELFAEQGYEETTVDQIVKRVGMSPRTFFRYIDSKEDLVLNHYKQLDQRLTDRLISRPIEEDAWTVIRRTFDVFVEMHADSAERERGALAQRLIESSPTLVPAYLECMSNIQSELRAALQQRGDLSGDFPLLDAIVGAAFAILHSVVKCVKMDAPADVLEAEMDRLFDALRPSVF